MKSVYVGRKASDNSIAVAFDILAVGDNKTMGKLLNLAAESGFIIDRVDREEVIFEEPVKTNYLKDPADKGQLEIDFSRSGGDRGSGPAEMPEGFSCNFSGECPTPGKSCTNCEHASNGIPKSVTVSPEVAAVVAEPEVQPEGEPTLVDEINASPMMQWAKNEAGEDIQVPSELLAEGDPFNDPVIDGKIEDGLEAEDSDEVEEPEEVKNYDPAADPTLEELKQWDEAVNGTPEEPAAQTDDIPF